MKSLYSTFACVALTLLLSMGCRSTPETLRLDVAPFSFADADAPENWASPVIREDILSRLSLVPDVVVVDHQATSSRDYVVMVATSAAGNGVLVGTLHKHDLGIYALELAIIDPTSGEPLWQETFKRKGLGAVVSAVRGRFPMMFQRAWGFEVGSALAAELAGGGTTNEAAYTDYASARVTLAEQGGPGRPVLDHLKAATKADPGFADAWSLLAALLADTGSREDALEATAHALRLRPHDASANVTRARLLQDDAPLEAIELAERAMRSPQRLDEANEITAGALETLVLDGLSNRRVDPDSDKTRAPTAEELTQTEGYVDRWLAFTHDKPALWRSSVDAHRGRVELFRRQDRHRDVLEAVHASWRAANTHNQSELREHVRVLVQATQALEMSPQDSDTFRLREGADYPAGVADFKAKLATRPTLLSEYDCTGSRLLHLAADRGSSDLVRAMVAAGAVVDARNLQMETALHRAAWRGQEGIIRALIDAGARVDARDAYGRTPLHRAAWGGSAQTVRTLLARGAFVEARTLAGWTALHEAARRNHPAIADVLIDGGAAIDGPNLLQETPLHVTATYDAVATAQLLLSKGAGPMIQREDGATPFHVAAFSGAQNFIALMLGNGFVVTWPDSLGRPPIRWAVLGEQPGVLDLLLDAYDTDLRPKVELGAMLQASAEGKIGIIERLVRRGVSLDAGRDDITPLIAAATGRQTTTVTRLVELGARVDGARSTDGATALHIAAGEGSVDVLTALLDAGADPNGADALGWPPLAFAIRNDQPDTLSALLAREARADFSVGAWSLLTLASIHNRKPIARTLMDHGAVETIYIATWLGRFDRLKAMLRKAPVALNQNGPDGLGLLHQAVRARSPKLVRYLLRKGARWDQWSDSVIDGEKTLPSWTPLHFAVFQGSAGLAVLLIEGGGDPFAQDDSGETPFAYADRIKPESRPMMKSAISRWKTKHSDDAMGTTEAIEWEGPSPNPAAAVGALGAIKSPTRSGRASGGIQLRERILDQDILVRSLLNGPDDKEGPADGHETQIRHCTRSTAYRAALRHTGDLLALRKKWEPSKSLTIAMSHHNLGRLSHYLARYDDAKRYLTMALGALSVRVLTGETTQASRLLLKATVLENLANLSAVLGDYGAAEEGFLTVLGVIEASAYRSPARLALTHSNLGNLYTEMGRYDDAEKAHRIALKLREDSFRPEATGVAASLNNLAAVLTIVGEHVRAEALYLRAHGLLEGVAAWVAADQLALAKFNVARGALRRGEWKPAEALVRAALEILLEAYSDGHYAVGRVQLGLAHALSALGRHDEAAKAVDAALPALRQAHGELHGFVARGLLLRSEIATQLGDLAAAEAALREALAIAYAADAPEERWPVEFAYGQRLLASGDTRRGIVFLKQAVNTLQGMRASLSGARSQSYAADRTAPYRLLADRLIVDGRLPEATQVLAMLKEEELARFATRSLAKLKAVVRNADFLPSEEAWLGRFRTIRDDLTALGTEFRKLLDKRRLGALTASGRSRLAALRKDLAIGRRAFDAFLSAIRKEVAATNLVRAENLAGRNLASLRAMQGVLKKLGHGAVLVHYLVTETGLRVLITTPDVQVARESKIPRAELNRLIADFRHALEDPETDVLPLAGRLYDVVVAPIADDLAAAEAKTLMLSLDGALRYVPFDALHDGDRFMLERYRLAHFTDASKPHLTAERPADWRIAALGLSMQHPGFDALPAVPAELHGIVKTKKAGSDGVSPGIVRLDADFTAATFQAALEDGFPVVHIASHFVFKPGTERDSFLLLGDAQQLTLDSIRYEGFAFDDVSLLTLSACNTAVGVTDVTAGSEVEGFAAMTQKLGVKSVVATLWPVADASTGQFMREMYARYGSAESTMTKADAVRQAKLTLLRGTVDLVQSDRLPQGHLPARDSDEEPAVSEGDFAHPYYWAPFVLMGNWL